MKQIDIASIQSHLSYYRLSGGRPSGNDSGIIEIETTEGILNELIVPAFPNRPIPPFIKHTIDEDKMVLIGPKE